jgi:hypothetical protein
VPSEPTGVQAALLITVISILQNPRFFQDLGQYRVAGHGLRFKDRVLSVSLDLVRRCWILRVVSGDVVRYPRSAWCYWWSCWATYSVSARQASPWPSCQRWAQGCVPRAAWSARKVCVAVVRRASMGAAGRRTAERAAISGHVCVEQGRVSGLVGGVSAIAPVGRGARRLHIARTSLRPAHPRFSSNLVWVSAGLPRPGSVSPRRAAHPRPPTGAITSPRSLNSDSTARRVGGIGVMAWVHGVWCPDHRGPILDA